MKTILCPTDFSSGAVTAAEYACAISEKLNTRVILFHAYEEPVQVSDGSVSILEDIKSTIQTSAEKQIKALGEKLQKKFPKCKITTMISQGSGHGETVAVARNLDADLIVMGTTGSNRIERFLIGSTTARVLKDAGCPVVCVPKGVKYEEIKKIVFATDLQNDNISAAITISPFAMKFGAEIIFVFVDDKHLMHNEKDIFNMTHKIKSRVKYPKISGYVANNPNIAEGIETFAKKYRADLLVMLAHDKNLSDSMLQKSYTKALSNKISMPLLVLKPADQLTI